MRERFINHLADRLEVSSDHLQPAYEDVWHYLWRERRLPTNVDPLKAPLDDPQERARLASIFEQGLGRPVGYVLPLAPGNDEPLSGWRTGPWLLRREHMFLLPGDSPIGLRLPLDSLPWVPPSQYPHVYPLDPFTELGSLPDPRYAHRYNGNGHARPARTTATAASACSRPRRSSPINERMVPAAPGRGYGRRHARAHGRGRGSGRHARSHEPMSGVVRTAICVEPREGSSTSSFRRCVISKIISISWPKWNRPPSSWICPS